MLGKDILSKMKEKVSGAVAGAKVASKGERRANEDLIVALDIGTEFVKALIARIVPAEAQPKSKRLKRVQSEEIEPKNTVELEIIGVGLRRQAPSDMHHGAIADISGVVKTCEEALSEAEDQAGAQTQKAIVGIAGELVKGNTSTIRYRRPNPDKPLDAEEMDFIIEKVQDRARERAQGQVSIETNNPDVEVKLVNSALVSIHIDGYKVSNPIGFQGKDVAVQIYTAFAPMVHIGAIERVCDELDLDLIAVAAEPFAVSRSVIGDDMASNFTAVLMDVGGGTTDVAVVDDGGVEGTKMFGIGGRSFTRQIENALDLEYDAAEKLKLEQANERIKPEVRRKLEEALGKVVDVWVSGVQLALEEMPKVDNLPNKILLCGGGASLRQIPEALLGTDWWTSLPFTRKPSVKLIEPGSVVGIHNATESELDHTFITVMGLLRVGCDTLAGVGKPGDSWKDRLSKALRV